MRRAYWLLGTVLAFAAGTSQADAELTVGIHRIEAEVMNTPQTREKGLMHRQSMAENHGMVFVFTKADRHCMWMANTLIPLSVAFMDGAGRVINIEDMQPQTRDIHCAKAPALFALEMNQGWFSKRGVLAGTPVSGVTNLPPAQ